MTDTHIAEDKSDEQRLKSWKLQYSPLHGRFRKLARTRAIFAHCVFALICLLLAGAAIVFLIPRSFNPNGVSDPKATNEKISTKISELEKLSEPNRNILLQNRAFVYNQMSFNAGNSGVTSNISFSTDDVGSKQTIEAKLKQASSSGIISVAMEDINDPNITSFLHLDGSKVSSVIASVESSTLIVDLPSDVVAKWKAMRSDLEALKSVQNLVASQIQQQEVSNLLGQQISFFGYVSQEDRGVNWASLIEPNITRFGTMIVVSFLVSILVPLYRYNIRLAAFYDARADGLELMKTNLRTNGFINLSASLTPALDFGKQPATPIEHIIELARVIAKGDSKKKDDEG
jgi:hypothetical protein